MTVCEFCYEDMLLVDGCMENWQVEYPDGIALPSIPYHSEKRYGTPLTGKRCHDCNVLPGYFHHPGCDVEECPRCGG